MKPLHTLHSRSRFHDICFAESGGTEILLVACDDGKIRLYDNLAGKERQEEEVVLDDYKSQTRLTSFAELVGHQNR